MTWVSSDPAFLSVAKTDPTHATITGVAPSIGNVTVTATVDGESSSPRVFTVVAGPLDHIEITPDGGTIGPNSMLPLSVRLLDQDGFTALGSSNSVLQWSSSNTSVATVTSGGVVTGVAAGTATITATYSAVGPTFTDVALVTVNPAPLGSVTVTPQTATIAAGASGTPFAATVRDINGMVVPLPAGKVSWQSLNPARATVGANTGTVTGVAAGIVTIRAIADGNTSISGDAQLDVTPAPGGISGIIRHSQTSNFIPGATVELRLGGNNTTGTTLATVTSDNIGAYTFGGLLPGPYTVVAKRAGFLDGNRDRIDVSNVVLGVQDVVLTPILPPGQTRIVLTWGTKPPDLDSHLTGPSGASRFRICWDKVGSDVTAPFARLDLDDIDGSGPETTTIYTQAPGDYFFYVFNFSATYDDPNATPLSASGARVQIFRDNTVVDFDVPTGAGNLWTVFSLTGGLLTPRNTITTTTEIPENGCSTTLPRRVDDASTGRSKSGKPKGPPIPPA